MDSKPPTLSPNRRMSQTDVAFLYLERKEIPLNIAMVALFDGAVPFEEFVAEIEAKLHLIPRFRQIPMASPFNIGYPSWELDPHFDIRQHIFHARLDAPGTEAQLEDMAGKVLSGVMERNKPLWDVHVVDGLAGGRGALIIRVHHAVADGVSGEAIIKAIFETTREGSKASRQPRPPEPPPKPAPQRTVTEAVAGAVYNSLQSLIAAEGALLDLAQGLFSQRMQKALQALVALTPELADVDRLPFNRPCGGERKFVWTDIDFAAAHAVHAAAGTTLNDVILTVVTRAIARYARLHGSNNRFIRIVCPVNVRRDDNGESMGNQITFLPVVLPLDIEDPKKLLQAVATRTEIMKSARAAHVVAILASWIGAVPPALQAAFWWGLPNLQLPVPLLNTICTNIPGSPVPLYCVGRRMIAGYPHVPTGYELGVNFAVQSYAGKFYFGLTADAHVASDVGKLRDLLAASFDDLCRAFRVKPNRAAQPEAKPAARKSKPRAAKVAAAAPEPAPAAEAPAEPIVMKARLAG